MSRVKGTRSPAELLAPELEQSGWKTRLVSGATSPILRFIHSVFCVLVNKPDLWIVDLYSTLTLYLTAVYVKLARWLNKKYVCTLHGGGLSEQYENKKHILDPILKNAVGITSPSLFLKEFFESKGYPVMYIPNPINLERFPFHTHTPIPASGLKLLWIRAFSRIYQPELAVQTLALCKKSDPECTLTMIGPDKGTLKDIVALAKTLHVLEAIQFTGPVANEKLTEYYTTHHVYLNTTRYESFGLAVVEAASSGIPVVSTRVGELPYIWTDTVSILFADASAEDFASKIHQLTVNPSWYETIPRNAQNIVTKFDLKQITPTWNQLLTRLLPA